MKLSHRPYLLLIFDGWGYSTERTGNAIAQAKTPTWDRLSRDYPHTLISGSGTDVGLPSGQMGNSEVGHLNMGAGRLVAQDYVRINNAIADGSFTKNPALLDAIDAASSKEKAIHIMGLLSPGGVHSHEDQLQAMVKLAAERGAKTIYVHAFLDGRDTAPQSAKSSLEKFKALFEQLGVGKLASLTGRYYAMDRDHRWQRTQASYDLLTQGIAARYVDDAIVALEQAYAAGETDEFVRPTALYAAEKPITVQDGDSVIFMNFRADRARQLTHALVDTDFTGFTRVVHPQLADFVTLTEYAADLNVNVAYRPQTLNNVFGAYIATLGLTQLRIAETEKYAHVTFFFNGGREASFSGEDRILVPSPKVATYDLQPEMSAVELTERLVAAIASAKYDVIICNFANPDMVGHTGKMAAAIEAVETVDVCLAKIIAALQAAGGETLITADHGNVEQMQNAVTGQPHTAHTSNLVPFVYVGRSARFCDVHGTLADVIPTLLYVMGLKQPSEMTGHHLLTLQS